MKLALAAIAAATLLAPAAHAATTVQVAQGSGQRAITLSFGGPIGQVFTAAGNQLLSFGYQLQTLNAGSPNAAVTLTIYEGAGAAGPALASVSSTFTGIPATRTPTWVDFDLGALSLTTGATYSALLTSSSSRYALTYGPDINLNTGQPVPGGTDAYAGGRIVAGNGLSGICAGTASICDANFRYTYDNAAAVPEPASWAMMIGGIGMAGGALRRRQRATVRFA